MCGGIKYTDHQNKQWTVYFPSPKAALPVIKKSGEIEWIKWGRRKEENVPFFPNGGWARLDSIKAGKWQRYEPMPVLIAINSFMEKDGEKVSHWFDLKPDEVLQGLLTVHDDEPRVYVVTTDTPEEFSFIHDRWPRVVQKSPLTESATYD
jgi:putative SOS response-associated peptidase YedK